ncbi:MAG: hypothetical protein ABIJ09_22275 [Pseudomonadota bacterium]
MITTTLLLTLVTVAVPAQFGPGEDVPSAAVPAAAPQPAPRAPQTLPATEQASTASAEGEPTPTPREPASEPASAPASQRRPLGPAQDDEDLPRSELQLKTCHGMLGGGDASAAARCYREAALTAQRGRDVRVAAALAGVADDIEARQRRESQPEETAQAGFGHIVSSGKAELVLWSGLFGIWFGALGEISAATLISQAQLGIALDPFTAAALLSGALLFPVATGAAGLALASFASVGVEELSAGDANLIRSALWMGVFDAIAWGMLSGTASWLTQQQVFLVPGGMFVLSGLLPGAAIAAATVVDLPEGGVALANSAALWTGVLATLGYFAVGAQLEFAPAVLLVSGAINAMWLGGLVASPWVPLSRPETWALDLGAALGLASSAALAVALNAPNPALGFGSMMAGTVIGGAVGLSAAYFGRRALEGLELPQLPEVVAMGPALLPTSRPWEPAAGVGITLRF